MTKLWKNVLVLWAIGMGIAISAPAAAVTSAVGPYYATPSWDQTLPAATRFIVLTNMNSAAVLDQETGLVWEQSQSTSPFVWLAASSHCMDSDTGGRKGWRLPTIQDLASLIDPTQSSPALPSGHPFSNVFSPVWSATTDASDTNFAYRMSFFNGSVIRAEKSNINVVFRAWCVRGGPGVDPQ